MPGVASAPRSRLRRMGGPVVKLDAIADATGEIRGVAQQALEWVRQSEERVAQAEAERDGVKGRAHATLARIGEEGRGRIEAEREKRRAVEQRVARAEEARDRAEKAFERGQRRSEA